MKNLLVGVMVLSGLLASQVLYADNWASAKLDKTENLQLSASNISEFNIVNGAGDIEVLGKAGQLDITVVAAIYMDNIAEGEYQLTLTQKGNKAILMAEFAGYTSNNARIDLKVLMPQSLALNVEDRSGDILIESVSAGVAIEDRSGSIELSNIAGGLHIEDRSGDIKAKNLQGQVIIEDRSGDIQLKSIQGNVTVKDTSGDIQVKDASGRVVIDDSSGDINVNGADDFKLINDGSGDVTLKNIRDNLK